MSVLLLACFFFAENLPAQESTRAPDQAEAVILARTLYELAFLRVQRLVPEFFAHGDTTGIDPEVAALVNEALQLAARQEWAGAEALLGVVAEYLSGTTQSSSPPISQAAASPRSIGTRWYPELFVGVEGWHQRFAVPGELQDTTLAERDGNPVIGLRLGFERGSARTRLTDGTLELRSSRDYQGGRLFLGHRVRFGDGHYVMLQNEIEGMAYREAQPPDFGRANLRCELGYALAPTLVALVGYTGSLQSYAGEDRFYASYVAHRLRSEVTALVVPSTRLSLEYEFGRWRYPHLASRDYRDHALRGRLFFQGLLVDGLVRHRHFTTPFADSLYNNPYVEAELRAEWRHDFGRWIALVLHGYLAARDYRFPAVSTPDYRLYEVSPALRLPVAGFGFLEVGYRLQRRTPRASEGIEQDQFSLIDQYLSFGPSVAVEYSGPRGFLLSASATLGKVIYPESPTRDVSGLSIYSDRRASSFMCFVTWPWSLHWELNVLANYDADLDVKASAYDSRTSVFTFELRYRF
ncbi:MAG: hypothetical protein ONB06_01705 [candidate division KSB1 bacterium]|nr:hypothetical protein [candidate division KSB1 bacterium]